MTVKHQKLKEAREVVAELNAISKQQSAQRKITNVGWAFNFIGFVFLFFGAFTQMFSFFAAACFSMGVIIAVVNLRRIRRTGKRFAGIRHELKDERRALEQRGIMGFSWFCILLVMLISGPIIVAGFRLDNWLLATLGYLSIIPGAVLVGTVLYIEYREAKLMKLKGEI